METEVIHNKPKKHHHIWLSLTIVFLGLFGFLIYSSFYNPSLGGSITGNIIKNSNPENNLETSANLNANLNLPTELTIATGINKISLKTNNPANLIFGDQKIELSEKTSIVIDEFQGSLRINEKELSEFEGKAKRVFINGLPISQKSNSNSKISFEEIVVFDYLKLEDFFLRSLAYKASGTIKINQDKIAINLNNDNFKINNFQGKLELTKKNLRLNGIVDQSEIEDILKTVSNIDEPESEESEETN
jgi:hypothetical protein